MLIYKIDSNLMGIRMYNKKMKVIFTTGGKIDKDDYRVSTKYFELV